MKAVFKEKIYKFKVPKIDPAQLIAKAIQDYEWLHSKKVNVDHLSEWNLNHILLNFIRHTMVRDYDKNCWTFKNNSEEYFYWFRAINNEIIVKYPFLKAVGSAQISRKRKEIFEIQAKISQCS